MDSQSMPKLWAHSNRQIVIKTGYSEKIVRFFNSMKKYHKE